MKQTFVTPSRIAAAGIFSDLRNGSLLDAAFDARTISLDSRDRRWVQELVWGTLRRRLWIDTVLAARIKGGLASVHADILDLLRLGAYQLIAMNSVPAYAAIAQTVEYAKKLQGRGAAGLVNAVLRRVDRERDTLEPKAATDKGEALALKYSHPQWLVERWLEQFGEDNVEALLKANNEEAPIFARPWRTDANDLRLLLESAGVSSELLSHPAQSLKLGLGVPLLELDSFKQGSMFIQDPAATFVAHFASFPKQSLVADLCASPGGKALELSRHAKIVIACDRNFARVEKMLVGFGRLDCDNIEVAVADARDPAISQVDAVLIDVPCTGTGTFRRHPDARWRLKASNLALLGVLQREIINGASACVKPGGYFVYSTCSLEPEENDDVVNSFLAAHHDFEEVAPEAGSVPDSVLDGNRLRVLPHVHGCDGAFAVRMRRRPL